MRVAIVTTSYPLRDGQAAGHFVASEARQLCAEGHDVTVIAPGPETVMAGQHPAVARIAAGSLFGPPGVLSRLRSNPLRAAGGIRFLLGARSILAQRGPFDRLIGHWLLPSVWPLGLGHAQRVEGVLHGSDVRLFAMLPSSLRDHIASRLVQHRVALRCVSEHVRDALLAATSLPLEPLVRIEPVLLDMSRSSAPLDLRSNPIPAGLRLIVIVARLVQSKRVRVALEAVAALPAARVVVVGGGPLRSSLERAFPDVTFTGELPRSEALAWIGRADVLVSASRHEGSPLVVREARALGVPVVACPSGDLERWAQDDAGLWVLPAALDAESA
jgi:glycosyltransferase involved in cell wall biosynthesis